MYTLNTIRRDDPVCYSLLMASRIGDGFLVKNGINYQFGSTCKYIDYLTHKKEIISKYFHVGNFRKVLSGYGETYSYEFRTRNSTIFTEIAQKPIEEIINSLDKTSLCYYYLDDGSFHLDKKFVHLYCNSFTKQQTASLKKVIDTCYSGDSKIRIDKKSNGKQYYYLYIGVAQSKLLLKDVTELLLYHNIESLMYKVTPRDYRKDTLNQKLGLD